jgi:hypothetical protein
MRARRQLIIKLYVGGGRMTCPITIPSTALERTWSAGIFKIVFQHFQKKLENKTDQF